MCVIMKPLGLTYIISEDTTPGVDSETNQRNDMEENLS